MQENWYQKNINDTYTLLASGEQGLSSAAAAEKFTKHGPNQLQEGKKKTITGILLAQFRDVMILILLAAAVISGLLGDMTDAIVILIIVLLNATIGFFQEYRAEKAMEALKQLSVTQAKIMRDNQAVTVPATELVPGDIVVLETGSAVPADLRLITSQSRKNEEAALTGESVAVDKITDAINQENLVLGDRRNMAFKGTFVAHGRATGIAVATGMQTELGRIAQLMQEDDVQTPLQQRMAAFARKLSVIVLVLCIVFFVAGWLRGEDIIQMVLTSISLAVAAIPEALPAVITISLALAARRMIKVNTLIRKLPAIETLGSVTYICTDKTGTLTRNKMYVEKIFAGNRFYDQHSMEELVLTEEGKLLLQAFALNNDAAQDNKTNTLSGDSTEIALLEAARLQQVQQTAWPRVAEIVFDSDRKLMTTFHSHENRFISFTKGAPDVLLKKCTNINTIDFEQKIEELAKGGMRVLGFAYRYWDTQPQNPTEAEHETGLIFLGLAGLIDPPREEVTDAVAQCRSAGIVPVMITGDHPLTAQTIAERIGIKSHENDQLLSGQQLSEISEADFTARVEQIKVYARVSPEQKLNIVKKLQEKGHYVAMTGDGVNDAPSLKRANIGIAMGITGTDVSKEAADMILMDDNFSTIIKAVKEGRRIYDNILKFIKYLMTTNSGELFTLLLGPIFGLPVALLPIHILWINLVSDGLPAISLSFEKAEQNIMSRPPRPPGESVFANGRGLHMIWVGLLMAAITLGAQAWAIQNHLNWQTIVFNVLCLSQMGHVLAIRSEGPLLFKAGFLSNMPLIWSVIGVVLLQIAITYIPFFQAIFHTQSLGWTELLVSAAASVLVFFAVEFEKRFKNRN